jgi:N-methylhydantoinase A/oxoprolinase/acetone carboxylase beta subunit
MKRVGVDVGGTHTDLVLFDEGDGSIVVAKVPTTPDPSEGAIQALLNACRDAECEVADVDYFMHGTTIATNIIIQHNGSKTGLITTDGFRDILHIARHKRPYNFSLQLDLPWQSHPLVQRRNRHTVSERITAPVGAVETVLDEDATRAAVRTMRDDGVEAIAVCFLFSFLNPDHERRVAEIIAEEAPGLFVSLSHQVIPQYREYERFSTTCLNSFVGPKSASYLDNLDRSLDAEGLKAELHLMQSRGGCATIQAAVQKLVTLLMSGPVAGLIGGIWCGRSAGHNNVITLDVGGTSADIGVAPGGELQYRHLLDTRIGDYDAMVPMVDVDTIGAGGGSVAYIDTGGQFQVGPKSAGAVPGPCCYGRGGTEPTATDCQLVLGRIDPAKFLGGNLQLQSDLARQAVEEELAKPLGVTAEEAALSALEILKHNMVQSIEINSVRKGYDPRDFALLAFGGAGPLFGCDIARELSIPKIIVPTIPGLTSALGLLTSDVAYDYGRTLMQNLGTPDIATIAEAYADLEQQAIDQLQADGISTKDTSLVRFADCRYAGQGYELRTVAPTGKIDDSFIADLGASFHKTHAREYGSSFEEKTVELVNIRVSGIGRIPEVKPAELPQGLPTPSDEALVGSREVYFEVDRVASGVTANCYRRDQLLAGNQIHGPAIIEQFDTTTVLPPDYFAEVDRFGNLIIELTSSSGRPN